MGFLEDISTLLDEKFDPILKDLGMIRQVISEVNDGLSVTEEIMERLLTKLDNIEANIGNIKPNFEIITPPPYIPPSWKFGELDLPGGISFPTTNMSTGNHNIVLGQYSGIGYKTIDEPDESDRPMWWELMDNNQTQSIDFVLPKETPIVTDETLIRSFHFVTNKQMNKSGLIDKIKNIFKAKL